VLSPAPHHSPHAFAPGRRHYQCLWAQRAPSSDRRRVRSDLPLAAASPSEYADTELQDYPCLCGVLGDRDVESAQREVGGQWNIPATTGTDGCNTIAGTILTGPRSTTVSPYHSFYACIAQPVPPPATGRPAPGLSPARSPTQKGSSPALPQLTPLRQFLPSPNTGDRFGNASIDGLRWRSAHLRRGILAAKPSAAPYPPVSATKSAARPAPGPWRSAARVAIARTLPHTQRLHSSPTSGFAADASRCRGVRLEKCNSLRRPIRLGGGSARGCFATAKKHHSPPLCGRPPTTAYGSDTASATEGSRIACKPPAGGRAPPRASTGGSLEPTYSPSNEAAARHTHRGRLTLGGNAS